VNYPEAVEYLYARLPMFHRIGAAAYKGSLDNIIALCAALGSPEKGLKCVHIAGTNGKGSVSSMVASILMEAGYKVGLHTSPHLRSFTERIRVNGKEISESAVAAFVTANQDLVAHIEPSFFELSTAMAFQYFKEENVDIAVIEVGMGGRLDSTNVIFPELAVVTSISLDHTQFLGDTLAAIAAEKAGILKHGIPLIIGEDHPETRPIFEEKAGEMGGPIEFVAERYQAIRIGGDLQTQHFQIVVDGQILWEDIECDLAGHYQRWNVPTAICVADHLERLGWEISHSAMIEGIKRASFNSGLKGRMSVLRTNPTVVADIAHNEAGIREVLAQLESAPKDQLHIIWGMVADKDVAKALSLLPKDAHYYFVKPNLPRGLALDQLQAAAHQAGLTGKSWPSVAEGYQAALATASTEDLIYVGGSTFVVAELI
jgi:dihydrofolate synthase/folylpolyglutamate synthase